MSCIAAAGQLVLELVAQLDLGVEVAERVPADGERRAQQVRLPPLGGDLADPRSAGVSSPNSSFSSAIALAFGRRSASTSRRQVSSSSAQ